MIRLVRTSLLAMTAALGAVAVGPAHARNASVENELRAQIRTLTTRLLEVEHRLDGLHAHKAGRAAKPKATTAETAETERGTKAAEEVQKIGPDKFRFKGITITPGGFIALEGVWRSHWLGADIATPYQNIPYPFAATGHASEGRFTARQSRLSLLVKGDIDPSTHVSGYIETDFLGAAQTANSNSSNSYNPRVRQLYTTIDWDEFGLHLLAGQAWSTLTMNSRGILPETVEPPPLIDAQYIPGFVWTRQPMIRLVADYRRTFWAAIAAEGSASTFAGYGALPPGVAGTTALPLANPILFGQAANGGLFNAVNSYSLNRMPDFTAKLAADLPIGDRTVHVEGFGLLRDFTDRAYWGNHSVWGGGAGAGVIAPIVPKLLDLRVSGMIGRGVGRYGAGQIADATWSVTGAPLPIHERMLLVGATAHVTPQTDLYMFAGGEFASKNPQYASYGGSTVYGGYGNPFFDNAGCGLENDALTSLQFMSGGTAANAPYGGGLSCAGQIKDLRQVTGGLWHTFYKGPFGQLRGGAQYSFTVKDAFPGFGYAPRATESMILTSFRYFPF